MSEDTQAQAIASDMLHRSACDGLPEPINWPAIMEIYVRWLDGNEQRYPGICTTPTGPSDVGKLLATLFLLAYPEDADSAVTRDYSRQIASLLNRGL